MTAAGLTPTGTDYSGGTTHIRGVITNIGADRIATAIQAGNPITIQMARFGGDMINHLTDDQLRASTDIYGKVYQCGSDAISCRLQAHDVIEYTTFLSTAVGNFDIGNYGLYDGEGNLLLIVAMNRAITKSNQQSPDGPNAVNFSTLVQYSNVTGGIEVNVETSGNASIPVVINMADVPDGTKSPYSAYIVERDTTFGNVGNLVVFSNNSWEGMTPASVGHYVYNNLQNAGIKYGAIVNESFQAKVLQGKRGDDEITVEGAYALPPYTQYVITGDGIAPDTVANKSVSSTFQEQSYELTDPLLGNVSYQDAVQIQTERTTITKATYPCYTTMNGTQLVLDGLFNFLDANTTYSVQGEYIPDNTTIAYGSKQEHDTIIRNRIQITPPIIKDVPGQHPCTITAKSHYSVKVDSVNLNTRSLVLKSPVPLPVVNDTTTLIGNFNRVIESGKSPEVQLNIVSCTANGDGTYTIVSDSIDNIVSPSYGEITVTSVSSTFLQDGAEDGQTEVSMDGSFDLALTEYTLSGDAFQPNTRIIGAVPNLRNITRLTMSQSITAPEFVENVVIQAATNIVENFDTTAVLPQNTGDKALSVAGTYSNVRYVKVDGHIYPVSRVTDTTDTASRTVLSLSKPIINDLVEGASVSITDPNNPIGDFFVLNRILSGFISKADSQDYINTINDLLQYQYSQGVDKLKSTAAQLAQEMGPQQQILLTNVQNAISALQAGLTNETNRASKQENVLFNKKMDIAGGTFEGSVTVPDSLTVRSTGNPTFNVIGGAGTASLAPQQGSDGVNRAVLSLTSQKGVNEWDFREDGSISIPGGGSIVTTPDTGKTLQAFTVSEVSVGQFISFPHAFTDDDDLQIILTTTSEGFVTQASYLGKSRAGFEINFLTYDQQGNLMPMGDTVIPDLSVIAVGVINT